TSCLTRTSPPTSSYTIGRPALPSGSARRPTAPTLGREMDRLSRLAYRTVWVNPRTQSARYRPLVGGMAAAWPHCDAVVNAHQLTAPNDLVAALADPVRRRVQPSRREH